MREEPIGLVQGAPLTRMLRLGKAGLLPFALIFLGSPAPGRAQAGSTSQSVYQVVVEHNVMVPMRDGVGLATDVYRPQAEGKFPVVLVRDPHGDGTDRASLERGHWWASRGYIYLHQDVRGRNDSEGNWYPGCL